MFQKTSLKQITAYLTSYKTEFTEKIFSPIQDFAGSLQEPYCFSNSGNFNCVFLVVKIN